MPIFRSTPEGAGLDSVNKFQSAPQTVTVVAALHNTAANGRFQIALSGCPKTLKTRCKAEMERIALATAFIVVNWFIDDEFSANHFNPSEPTEPKQERRGVSMTWLPVQMRQLED
jgi:hypothetical protein